MGLFDFLKKKDDAAATKVSARELARLSRVVGEKLAQDYDRQEALLALGKLGSAESASALLRRFGFSMEPSITDEEEKEMALEGIAAAGEAAVEPIRTYCAKAESLIWPLKALRKIVSDDDIVDELLGVLDLFDTEYTRNPEPKIQIIAVLEDYPGDEVREAVEPFLGDVNESVRFRAVDTVFSMDDERSVFALVAALEEEESLRVKNRIAAGLAERGWGVPAELRDTCDAALPAGYALSDGKVEALG